MMKVIVGITGASGSVYARLLTRSLLEMECVEVCVIVTDNGRKVMRYEDSDKWLNDSRIRIYDNSNMFEAPASGSSCFDAMVIVPCSMGTLGRIAAGMSADLLCRTADVMMKERRRLIIVPRETPLSGVHLRNMSELSNYGAIIAPASPSFYSKGKSVEDICRSVTDRLVSLLGLDAGGFKWDVR